MGRGTVDRYLLERFQFRNNVRIRRICELELFGVIFKEELAQLLVALWDRQADATD